MSIELGQATGDPRTPSIFIRTLNAGQTTSDGRPDIAIERCTDANMRTKAQKRGKDGVKKFACPGDLRHRARWHP